MPQWGQKSISMFLKSTGRSQPGQAQFRGAQRGLIALLGFGQQRRHLLPGALQRLARIEERLALGFDGGLSLRLLGFQFVECAGAGDEFRVLTRLLRGRSGRDPILESLLRVVVGINRAVVLQVGLLELGLRGLLGHPRFILRTAQRSDGRLVDELLRIDAPGQQANSRNARITPPQAAVSRTVGHRSDLPRLRLACQRRAHRVLRVLVKRHLAYSGPHPSPQPRCRTFLSSPPPPGNLIACLEAYPPRSLFT